MIPEIVPVNNWTGNNSTIQFDFDFLINSESELTVIHTNKEAEQKTLQVNIDYTINQIGNKNGSYITFPIQGSQYGLLQNNEIITLALNLPIAQTSPYGTSTFLNLDSLEFSLDYVTRLIQILSRKVDRSIKVEEGTEQTPEEWFSETLDREVADFKAGVNETITNQNEEIENFKSEINITIVNQNSTIAANKSDLEAAQADYENQINATIEQVLEAADKINVLEESVEIANEAAVTASQAAVTATQQATIALEKAEEVNESLDLKANIELNNLTISGEKVIKDLLINDLSLKSNTSLNNLSSDGEKHFINKTQVTNCILESPHMVDITLNAGTINIAAGFRVIVPYNTSAPQKEIGDSLNGGTIVDISWNDGKLFYIVEYGEKTYSYTGSTTASEGFFFIRPDGNIGLVRANMAISGTGVASNFSGLYYNTSTNAVTYYSSGTASYTNASLPFCKLDFGTNYTNNIGEIKEVFQATGYIGSTMWAMKGIKLLSGNGRNEDGSLNNRNITTSYIYTNSATTTFNGYFGFNGAGIYSFRIEMVDSLPETLVNSTYYYVIPENKWYWSRTEGNPTQGSLGILGSIVRTADGIQSMSPYETFRAVDYNEYNESINSIQTNISSVESDFNKITAYITSSYRSGSNWYRIWSDGWCEQGGLTSATSGTVTLLKKLTTPYSVQVSIYNATGVNSGESAYGNLTSNTFDYSVSDSNGITGCCWVAKGKLA